MDVSSAGVLLGYLEEDPERTWKPFQTSRKVCLKDSEDKDIGHIAKRQNEFQVTNNRKHM